MKRLAILSLLVIACGTEPFTPPTPATETAQLPLQPIDQALLAGTWILQAMDGRPLPYWIGDRSRQAADGYKVEVTAETMVVAPPDRVIRTFSISNTNFSTGVVRRGAYADTGSYLVTRTGVRFSSEMEPSLLGVINGTTLSAAADMNTTSLPPLFTSVYEKQ